VRREESGEERGGRESLPNFNSCSSQVHPLLEGRKEPTREDEKKRKDSREEDPKNPTCFTSVKRRINEEEEKSNRKNRKI
jgi:hypothetical protein